MTALAPRVRVRRDGMPVAPVEIADEVELYAREHGRTAHLHFFPTLFVNGRVARGTWVVRLSLKPNDPEMLLYREGKRPEPPTEDVWIHSDNPRAGQTIPGTYGQREPPHLALDIHQMGASGVRQFLEKGNLDSGRGEFGHKTLEQIVRETREKDAAATARVREQAKQGAVDIAMDRRRSIFGIPFHRVGIDLKALAGKVARRSNPTGAATGRAKES